MCDHIQPLSTSVRLIILQHPKETHHAKNTAKLVKLCLSDTFLTNGVDGPSFDEVSHSINPATTALCYPCQQSQPIEQLNTSTSPIDTVMFIDGSWKQAYGMWQQYPWLQQLQLVHFDQAPVSEYQIRHTALDYSLSTLEAVAYGLHRLTGSDFSALNRLQQRMQSFWQGPAHHRRNTSE